MPERAKKIEMGALWGLIINSWSGAGVLKPTLTDLRVYARTVKTEGIHTVTIRRPRDAARKLSRSFAKRVDEPHPRTSSSNTPTSEVLSQPAAMPGRHAAWASAWEDEGAADNSVDGGGWLAPRRRGHGDAPMRSSVLFASSRPSGTMNSDVDAFR